MKFLFCMCWVPVDRCMLHHRCGLTFSPGPTSLYSVKHAGTCPHGVPILVTGSRLS